MSDINDDDKKPKKFNPPHSGAVPQAERVEHFAAMTPPAPAASPSVPIDDEDATWRPPTRDLPVTRAQMTKALNINDVKTFVAMVAVAIAATFAAYKFVMNDARAQTDAGVQVLSAKHEDLRREVERYQQSNDKKIDRVQNDVEELRKDLREFYKSWRDDKPSPRLEQPLPVRHTPDAGR